MTRTTELFVPGTPQPQGSKSAFAIKKGGAYTGGTSMTEQNKKLKPWRRTVADAVRALGAEQHHGPVAITLMFVFGRPQGHYGTGRNAGVLKPSAPGHHAVKPDVDKLCRSILDSLKDSGLIEEDSRASDLNATKRYVHPAIADRAQPGVLIVVETIT